MEDGVTKVSARFDPQELRRMRQILLFREKYIEACRRLIRIQAEVDSASNGLHAAIDGIDWEPSELPPDVESKLLAALTQNADLREIDTGDFALLNSEAGDGALDLWHFKPEYRVELELAEPPVSGPLTFGLHYLNFKDGKGLLVWEGEAGSEPDPLTFYVAISVDSGGPAEQQVAMSWSEYDEGDSLYEATAPVYSHLWPAPAADSGQVDA